MAFIISSSPHGHSQQTSGNLMRLVMLAMLPGILTQWFLFGWGSLVQLLLAASTALLAEAGVLQLRGRRLAPSLSDSSALLTATLLAVAIPPLAPWWLVVLGSGFAIVVAKQLYGGLGQNPFNPAMVAYVLLLVSFPAHMTAWLPPAELARDSLGPVDTLSVIFTGLSLDGQTLSQLRTVADGITMATPLDAIKTGLGQGLAISDLLQRPMFDVLAGKGWQWVNLAYLLGGLFLLATRNIAWQIPFGILLALGAGSLIGWQLAPGQFMPPHVELLSGATMLGAFFIATDPVTAATSPRGRLLYGLLIGALLFIIRSWGGYPDGVAFSVLLANLAVPLLDRLTRPRVYGEEV